MEKADKICDSFIYQFDFINHAAVHLIQIYKTDLFSNMQKPYLIISSDMSRSPSPEKKKKTGNVSEKNSINNLAQRPWLQDCQLQYLS